MIIAAVLAALTAQDSDRTLKEVQEYVEARIPQVPKVRTAAEWKRTADRLRADVLEKVVFRGKAAAWRDAPSRVVWAGDLEGGPGYRIRKLRYEALPGLWIPALLYRPEKITGKVPVHLAVNGHTRVGKVTGYKQIRCINLARRGMIVLNVEWLGMGQLNTPGFDHYKMNQLNLCGTSGLAPFYLSMSRGIDLLLSLEHADPERVAVHGLSGGGWQTIFISALDPRVTFSNPVAGYSSFLTRVRHLKDLGDSEQTPCDLATVADYTHLTAMRAPRPTLLTYNAKDNCCFESGYAMEPLIEAALPAYVLFKKQKALTWHVNHDPGNHNFGKDNRQALYRAIGAAFFPGKKDFDPKEIECEKEIKSKDDLFVELPKDNHDFSTLAKSLALGLPRSPRIPAKRAALIRWQESRRLRLRQIVRWREDVAVVEGRGRLRILGFTVPVRAKPEGPFLLRIGDGDRTLAVDPFYFGESRISKKDFLYALLVSAVGERPLGIQAGHVAYASEWASKDGPVTVVAKGPRSCLIALVAAAIEKQAIAGLELHGSYGSLKQILEEGLSVRQAPELFCFGLLEGFDIRQLVALIAPRPVRFVDPGERVKKELSGLRKTYELLEKKFDPLR